MVVALLHGLAGGEVQAGVELGMRLERRRNHGQQKRGDRELGAAGFGRFLVLGSHGLEVGHVGLVKQRHVGNRGP